MTWATVVAGFKGWPGAPSYGIVDNDIVAHQGLAEWPGDLQTILGMLEPLYGVSPEATAVLDAATSPLNQVLIYQIPDGLHQAGFGYSTIRVVDFTRIHLVGLNVSAINQLYYFDKQGVTVTVHLIPRDLRFPLRAWFRPTLLRLEAALGDPLDPRQKPVVSKRPADALGRAQVREGLGVTAVRFSREQVGKVREAVTNGCAGREPIVLAGEMRARARPAPVLRADDQPRAHRIERHVAQGGREMILVHRHRPEAALPEMAGALAARMNDAGVATMHGGERAPQPVNIGRHQNEMHMIGHHAPGPHRDIGRAAVLRQKIAIERVVCIVEEGARTAVAALGDVVRNARDNDAGQTSHII
jgi:hypothetical protein